MTLVLAVTTIFVVYRYVLAPLLIGPAWSPTKAEVLALVPFTLQEPWSVQRSDEQAALDHYMEVVTLSQARPQMNPSVTAATWTVIAATEYPILRDILKLSPSVTIKSARRTQMQVNFNGRSYNQNITEINTSDGWIVRFELFTT